MVVLCVCMAQPFRIMSYNVENLFDTIDNPLTADDEFVPQSDRHWDTYRYWHKMQKLSEVIVNVGEWYHAAIVGLIEVEDSTCLRDLCRRSALRTLGYRYIHYESQDVRGIDVAMLYDPNQFRPLVHYPLVIDFGYETRPTRDLLYVKGLMPNNDTLHLMVCHAPSQLGGTDAKQKRRFVLNRINQFADSLLTIDPMARIVLMGDFNDNPKRVSPYIPTLQNMMELPIDSLIAFPNMAKGTYVYQELWSLLDQFFVSQSLSDVVKAQIYNPDWLIKNGKPHRTYTFIRYDRTGFSDHLPIYLDIPL